MTAELFAWLTSLLIFITGSPPVPQEYVDRGMVRGDECGAYTNVCWHGLVDEGFGPLVVSKRSGLTWLQTLGQTLWCESRWQRALRYVNRDGSVDRGIAQINDEYHPDVSDAQADNPYFAIRWMTKLWRQGKAVWWVCYLKLFGPANGDG